MKQPFREDQVSRHQDTLDGRVGEFDWRALASLLGEVDDADPKAPDIALLGEVLNRLLAWLTADAKVSARKLDRLIGRRALVMVWVIRPDLIKGTPSLAKMADLLGLTRAALSAHAAEFSRQFGIRNRPQVGHGGAWQEARQAAQEQGEGE